MKRGLSMELVLGIHVRTRVYEHGRDLHSTLQRCPMQRRPAMPVFLGRHVRTSIQQRPDNVLQTLQLWGLWIVGGGRVVKSCPPIVRQHIRTFCDLPQQLFEQLFGLTRPAVRPIAGRCEQAFILPLHPEAGGRNKIVHPLWCFGALY
jgi:hypothetical protein